MRWMLEVQDEHDMRIRMNLTLVSIQTCHMLNIQYFNNVCIKANFKSSVSPTANSDEAWCRWWLESQLLWEVAQEVEFLQLIVEWICYNPFVYQEILVGAGSGRKNNPIFTSLWMPSPCLEVQSFGIIRQAAVDESLSSSPCLIYVLRPKMLLHLNFRFTSPLQHWSLMHYCFIYTLRFVQMCWHKCKW